MRTPEQIRQEFTDKGCVYLSAEENSAINADSARTVFFTFSETTTIGDRTITRSASVSVPVGYDADTILDLLRAKVQGSDHFPSECVL